ncbi:MAG: hypothetical protein AAB212_10775, partial [Bacteroidota bacterium]
EREWAGLLTYAKKDTIVLDKISGKDKADLLQRMQALMGRQIWRNEGYFEVANRKDVTVQKAIANFKLISK